MITLTGSRRIAGRLPWFVLPLVTACGGGGGGSSGPPPPPPPPSLGAVTYSSPAYSFTVGVPAQSLTPTVQSGTATSWSISPVMPAGLTFSTTDGTISGTPTMAAASAAYKVTAQNSDSQSSTTLNLTVAAGPLLDLGHVSSLYLVRMSGNTVLSQDLSNHWVLWNYVTGAQLASNAPCLDCSRSFVDMAGSTAVMQTSTGLEVRSATDGTLLAEIGASPAWWMLAADGSYVAAGSTSGLTLWSPSGTMLFTVMGDYSKALAYAGSGQIGVALGPAGADVIQTISVPGGAATLSPSFQGTFQAWFVDGSHFFSAVLSDCGISTWWIYSPAAVQQDLAMLNTGCLINGRSGLSGTGNWYWLTGGGGLYAVGSSGTPYAAYPSTGAGATPVPHTQLLGWFAESGTTILDLSGASPVAISSASPPLRNLAVTTNWEYPYPFAATSSSVWVVGGASGELVDGASLAGQVRYFDYGEPFAIAGSTTNVAVATATGRLIVIDTATGTIETTISMPLESPPSSLMLSDDGSVISVVQNLSNPVGQGELTTTIYELPAGTAVTSFLQGVYTTLSASGTALGKIWFSDCTATAQTIATGQIFWTTGSTNDCGISGLQLSPDASEIALEEGGVTSIYQNGTFATTISATGLIWLGDGELLTITSQACCDIYSSTGTLMTSLSLPNLLPFAIPEVPVQVVPPTANPTAIYSSLNNSIYSLSNGRVTWTSGSQSSGAIVTDFPLGVLSGTDAVFQFGNLLLAEPY